MITLMPIIQKTMDPKEYVMPIVVVKDEYWTHENVCWSVAVTSTIGYLNSEDETWEPWLKGRFTKTVRHASPKEMAKLPKGIATQSVGYDPHIIVYSPMMYQDFPKELARTQVQGLDYPSIGGPINPRARIQIYMNPNIEMSTGKAAAQASHALMTYFIRCPDDFNTSYIGLGFPSNFDEIEATVVIQDAGFTEVEPGTVTAKLVAN